MDHPTTSKIASAALNLCDRVDILDAIIHDSETPLDSNGITDLLDRCYPSFVRLCEELRGDLRTTRVKTAVEEDSITFYVTMSDESQRMYSFKEFDTRE